MPTGACGINCDVCRLNLLGLCTTCGAGKSSEARLKLDTQERILGSTCPVLSCCVMNCKDYCIRDCSQFPCENYEINPYPFSQSYLEMQKRRRVHPTLQMDPLGKPVSVPEEYWKDLAKKDLNLVTTYTLADLDEQGRLCFQFLNRKIHIDLDNHILVDDKDEPTDNSLLELIVLSYFRTVDRLYPMGKDLISPEDMKQGIYFTGMNALKTEPVLRRFQNDLKELTACAKKLGGEQIDMADASVVLYPFPRVPVYYLIWGPEEEYESSVSILFDRSVESVFQPPLIWALVNLVNSYLLTQ